MYVLLNSIGKLWERKNNFTHKLQQQTALQTRNHLSQSLTDEVITDDFPQNPLKCIHNFSDYELDPKQIEALSLGFNFKTPNTKCDTSD